MCRVQSFFVCIFVLSCMLLSQFGFPVSIFADDFCVSKLLEQAQEDDPYSYQKHGGDRCEGTYSQDVSISSDVLDFISLTESFAKYDLEQNDMLNIDWSVPQNENIRLEAHDLIPGIHYRMDSSPSRKPYDWPMKIIKKVSIPWEFLGVAGWYSAAVCEEKEKQNVYVPLRIQPNGDTTQAENYQVEILPKLIFNEFIYSLERIVWKDGKCSYDRIFLDKSLESGPYPADEPVTITIPGQDLNEEGVYYLLIEGKQTRSTSSIDTWFYCPGNVKPSERENGA